MSIGTSLLKLGNKVFPKVVHPFNLNNDGIKTYAQWQFEKGDDTVACFAPKYTPVSMFAGKTVLDMGCGAAGKSLYYITKGANRVVGVDIVPSYEEEAMTLAKKLGLDSKFSFVCASAFELPFPDGSFDTIIMNDFMEHVSQPAAALTEALRLISPNGSIYINFPPYYHPFGAHLSDAINMPWAHMFFSEKTLIKTYKSLIKDVPDAESRIKLRFSTDSSGNEHITYINRMTLRKFNRILKELEITPAYYREIPLRGFLSPLAKLPGLKEMFVKMAVCVITR